MVGRQAVTAAAEDFDELVVSIHSFALVYHIILTDNPASPSLVHVSAVLFSRPVAAGSQAGAPVTH